MLTVTPTAAEALRSIVDSTPDVPDSAGLRISQAAPADDGTPRFEMALAEGPIEGDQVVDGQTVPVFLDEGAAQVLDDKTLDAQLEQGRVGFVLTAA